MLAWTESYIDAFPPFLQVTGTTTFAFHSGGTGTGGDYSRKSDYAYTGFKICAYPPTVATLSLRLHPVITTVLFGAVVFLIAPIRSKESETGKILRNFSVCYLPPNIAFFAAGIAVFGEFTGVFVAVLAARAHLPSLVEAQPCHTDTSGLKVGVVVAAFLFVFFRWKGGSGLDVGSGRFFFRPDWIRVG
jgi:hypothetical protein